MSASFSKSFVQPLIGREDLTRDQAREALGQILTGSVDPTLIAAFLTAFTAKGETVDEMTGFVDAMMAVSTPADAPDGCVDIVGTGGDQLHSVNVSSMASFAVAGADVRVAKHGNRSATSSVGSADVLEALGINIDIGPDTVRRCIEEAGFGFYFAPTYHSALKYLSPIRRTLGFRTVFNILGPLANPAQVRRSVIGVAQEAALAPMARVLAARGVDKAILVRGADGLDELSLGGPSTLVEVSGPTTRQYSIDAGEILERRHEVAELVGGDVSVNVAVFEAFLNGEQGAVFDVVCANAALALVAADRASDLAEGFALASESVLSGSAARVLNAVREISNN